MLKLVCLSEEYRLQLTEMMDEWTAVEDEIIPSSIRKIDYHDFDRYLAHLQVQNAHDGHIPASTYFCLDTDSNHFVGAVNIRHYLNDSLMRTAGHIGNGVRPSMRGKGIGTKMLHLALEKCRELHISRVLMVCKTGNSASAAIIRKNGGVFENQYADTNGSVERYWIALDGSPNAQTVSFTNFYDSMQDDPIPAFARAMTYLREHPGAYFMIPAETYPISTPLAREAMESVLSGKWGGNPQRIMFNPHYRYDSALSFTGQSGVTVLADHAVLMINGFMEPITIADCTDITLRGLTIDHLRKPYSFGKIESLGEPDADGKQDCLIRLDDASPIQENSPICLRHAFFHQDTGASCYLSYDQPVYRDPYHIFTRVEAGKLTCNDHFYTIHTYHSRPAILIERAKNIRIEKVTIHSQPGMGIVGNRSENVIMEELAIVPSQGLFWSTNTDATHFTSMKGLLRFHHCTFSHHGDDATNVHGYYQAIVGKVDSHTYLLQEKTPDGTHAQSLDYPDIGDTLELSSIDSLALLDTLTVVDCVPMPDEWMCRVTLDHPLPEDVTGMVLSDVTRLPRVEFVENTVSHHFARSVLLKNRDSLVEGNTFHRSRGPAVVAASEAGWYEGVCPANLTVRNNRILDCGCREALGVVVNTSCAHPTGQPIHNILIENNCIEGSGAHAIYVSNAANVTVRNNRCIVNGEPVILKDCVQYSVD